MSSMITADLVDLDLSADTKDAAARALAERMVAQGRVTDLDGFLADVAAREAQMPTGLDGGIGIPHCRSEHVTEPTLAFGRSAAGIDFGAADGPADLIFLIAAPAGADDAHLTILSSLARQLMNAEFTSALRSADDAAAAAALIRGDEAPEAAPSAGEDSAAAPGAASAGAAAGSTRAASTPARDNAPTSEATSAAASETTRAAASGAPETGAAPSASAPTPAPGATSGGPASGAPAGADAPAGA
ncbi:fructose PTS transporter subunit IIA, partial [Streptomyces sp. NPDC005526]|uniref:PTS sugar transporter subunit IIA n=1 Tax=Streptomyces sp. NPDC005526 TaxID=3156885 RepID=UPI0033B4AC27